MYKKYNNNIKYNNKINKNMNNEMLKRIYDELINLHDFYNDLKDEDGLRNVNYLLDELNKNIKE